jgi:predicted TIM-barrel fold metal-dependent hydrolase
VADAVVDCDVHPEVPDIGALMPHFSEAWQEILELRGIDGFRSANYPPNAPLACRPDWRVEDGPAGGDVAMLGAQVLGRLGADRAILNCLYAVQMLHDEHMAAAFARAVNDWLVADWLDADPRLAASIVVAPQNPELAVEEIERRAGDSRFVQVLLLAAGDLPLGRRQHWPIYEAAVRHGLPIGIHAGTSYRQPPTSVGWPSTHLEEYVGLAQAFQGQVASLITHGVFNRLPELKVVLIESGITWLPPFLWRLSKFWRGVRVEVPWLDQSPAAVFRDHFRVTLQPLDGPPGEGQLQRLLEQLGSDDVFLYSSDYPHWQFDGEQVIPDGIGDALRRKMRVDNPRATYPRLADRPVAVRRADDDVGDVP